MWDQEGIYGEANYQRFKVMSEADNYKLIVGQFSEPRDRLHSTHIFDRAGDSFSGANSSDFRATDRPNHMGQDSNCVEKYFRKEYFSAGWLRNCLSANIFGTDTNKIRTHAPWEGITWKSFRGSRYSLKQLVMAIRPKQHNSYGTYCNHDCTYIQFSGLIILKVL